MVQYAGTDIFKIFQYPFIEGNANTAFKDPYSIVLTQSLAKSLFGNEDPMNKTVRFDNAHDLKVTGIIKDVPENATFSFKYVVPSSYSLCYKSTNKSRWVKQFQQ